MERATHRGLDLAVSYLDDADQYPAAHRHADARADVLADVNSAEHSVDPDPDRHTDRDADGLQ